MNNQLRKLRCDPKDIDWYSNFAKSENLNFTTKIITVMSSKQ